MVTPGSARAVRFSGSTLTPFIWERSIRSPPSHRADAGDVVAAPAHRNEQVVLAGEVDRVYDVGHARRAGYERGPPVDHAVPDLAGLFVARVAGTEQLAAQARPELLDDRVLERARAPSLVVT